MFTDGHVDIQHIFHLSYIEMMILMFYLEIRIHVLKFITVYAMCIKGNM